MPRDSILLHVAQLRVAQLLAHIQRRDLVALEADLEGVELGEADRAAQAAPGCATVQEVVAALSSTTATPAGSLPAYLTRIRARKDSGGATVEVDALLTGHGVDGAVRAPVTFSVDPSEGRLTKVSGLLAWLCSARAAVRP